MKKILFSFIILLVTPCLGKNLQQAFQMSTEEFSKQIEVTKDKFSPTTFVESMTLKDGYALYWLRSTSKNVHVIYVAITYSDLIRPPGGGSSWIYYENARLVGGKALRTKSLKREVSNGSSGSIIHQEQFVIYVDPLNDNLNEVQVSGPNFRNPVIVQLPNAYIQSHINAVNTTFEE